jgi:hypothetical protein
VNKPRSTAWRLLLLPKTLWLFRRWQIAAGDATPLRSAWALTKLATFRKKRNA